MSSEPHATSSVLEESNDCAYEDETDQEESTGNRNSSNNIFAKKTLCKPQRFHSKAVGFGRNYFHALGGMTEHHYMVDDEKNNDTVMPSTMANFRSTDCFSNKGINSNDFVGADNGSAGFTYFAWDEPPWQNDDSIRGSSDTQRDEVKQVVATAQSTVYLTNKGKIFQTGTLHGRIFTEPEPILIPLPLKCVQVSAGRHFCLARMEGGLATVSWGAGHFGQLGLGGGSSSGGDGGASSIDGQITFTPQPVIIERLLPHVIGSPIEQVAAGDWHALALSKSGRIWAFGSNRSLQCGRKPTIKGAAAVSQAPTLTAPLPVPLEGNATYIAAGRSHSLAIVDGQVYAFGGALQGQCGNSVRRTGVAPPKKVDGLSDLTVVQVAAGGSHSVALTSGGRLFTWGAGTEGELGFGQVVSAQVKPRLLSDLDFVAIEAGQEWKIQQKGSLAASAVAANASATEIDTSSTQMSTSLSDVTAQFSVSPLPGLPKITKVFAGPSYCAALSSSGHLYTWGTNDIGQLGIPRPSNIPLRDNFSALPPRTSTIRDLHVRTFDSAHNVLLPTRVDAVKDLFIRDIACGPNHTCCIGEDRDVKQHSMVVGRTLYEVQEEQRLRKLYRARNSLLSKLQSEQEDGVTEGTTTQTDVDEASDILVIPASPQTPCSSFDVRALEQYATAIMTLPETPSMASVSTVTDIPTPATLLSDTEPDYSAPSTEMKEEDLTDLNGEAQKTSALEVGIGACVPVASVPTQLMPKLPKTPGKRRRFVFPKLLRKLSGRLKDDSTNNNNNDVSELPSNPLNSQHSLSIYGRRRRNNKQNTL